MEIQNQFTKSIRKIRDLKKVSYKEYDKNGKQVWNHYVEYTVIGNNGTWRDFMPIEIFKQLNPHINLEKYAK
jgi:hypothetical protein